MDVLQAPLEALVFDYVSFGFITTINCFWTWVAVLTAAVSFWRIRAVGSSSLPTSESEVSPPVHGCWNSDESQQAPLELTPSESSSEEEPARACSWVSSVCAIEEDCKTKGKFTVYFEGDGDDISVSNLMKSWGDGDVGVFDGGVCSFGEEMYKSWEGLLARRRGDLGWYCFQDLTVVDSGIVRLWDGN